MSRPSPLTERYVRRTGDLILTGVQALVRLMLDQAAADEASGIRTGGFVSGYRGSPLGTLDMAFARAEPLVEQRGIVVKPAVNEEMAATAVAGSQQIEQTNGARVDGVFSLWYGKGPGLDRASDAIRHGNYQGASRNGGVVLAVGDDHVAKSSSIVCYSDEVVAGLQVPLLYPADAGEIVAMGLHGFAMSRHTGSWTALKILTEVADSTRVLDASALQIRPVLPTIIEPANGLHVNWPETPLDQEARQQNSRLPAILDYVRANQLDRQFLRQDTSRIGIIAAGKSWLDLREAFQLLGLDDKALLRLGVALYKPALVWPLEPDGLRTFTHGLSQLLVVEEKGPFIEAQVKTLLFDEIDRPSVWGKFGPDGAELLSKLGDLTPERIAVAVGALLAPMDSGDRIEGRLADLQSGFDDFARLPLPPSLRKPFFCSGCPHNRSTVVPVGSRALAGIGCHGLAAYNRPRTGTFSQMGGEGIHWMGLAPFTSEPHVFANMGDGTYFHSGLLAVRQAVAANLDITYKILFNSAVAMTGGQAVDGELTLERVIAQLRAEGVHSVILVSDEPKRHTSGSEAQTAADGVHHRDDLETLQRELREKKGVNVIVYEQMCATEKRRLRKRKQLAEPSRRVFINELVCEGCGDCSITSNCLSVEPFSTSLGTKRRINQSSCNKDYSCLEGFCPSFVSVENVTPRRGQAREGPDILAIPEPTGEFTARQRIMVVGVGGTGVVTIGALLTMSSHLGGGRAAVLDQVGMAQKGGAVTSHVHLVRGGELDSPETEITALRIPRGQADLIIACDELVGTTRDTLAAASAGRTRIVANSDVSVTGDFTQDRAAIPDSALLTRRLSARVGPDRFAAHPFSTLSTRLLGDALGANLMMAGFAYQKGWLDIDLTTLDEAIEINGQAVSMNMAAFAWGRRLAQDPGSVEVAAGLGVVAPESFEQMVERRAAFLTEYQNVAYADRYRHLVASARSSEVRIAASDDFSRAVAQGLFRVMSYKDEYEVARLHTNGTLQAALSESFEGKPSLTFHLAPPLLARRDANGMPRKRAFGPWILPVFRTLAKLKFVRGTPFDLFGWTSERRTERQLLKDYINLIGSLTATLTSETYHHSTQTASLILEVRGYGHVKAASVDRYRLALLADETGLIAQTQSELPQSQKAIAA